MIKDRNMDPSGISSTKLTAEQQYIIMKPSVSAAFVVATEDISGGDVASCTIARGTLDYPRNLLYSISDATATTNVGTFTVVGTDVQDNIVTEIVVVTVATAVTMPGTQVFKTVTSVAYGDTSGTATTSDTASVGVNITADVASFGLPSEIALIADVKNVNWIDSGASKAQNIDATSVVVARNCFRPEQTVAAADDYVITYKSTTVR